MVWFNVNPDHIWIMDKLILSKKMGYVCGPIGIDVPAPNFYIVRPCVNPIGLGMGTQKVWIEKHTDHLPLGHFWCEVFEGRHLSVDYENGNQVLCVEGFKSENTFVKWDRWSKVEDVVEFPLIAKEFINHYETINCEFIGGRLIEIHFRRNEDFDGDVVDFIPVWEGQDTNPIVGYKYRKYPDLHGRIGAFIKCGYM